MRVAIGGAGCFGSGVAMHLVRAGVGHIRVADPDRVELSNINRQAVAGCETVGKFKVDALRDMLRSIAVDFELVTTTEAISERNAEHFVDGCDVVIDEIDVFEPQGRIILHKAARSRSLPIYAGCAVGYGFRFFKFVGEDYTLEQFLGDSVAGNSLRELLHHVGPPFPSYLDEAGLAAYVQQCQDDDGAALCGSTAAMGIAFLSARVTGDYLAIPAGTPSPVMPRYIALDAADLTFSIAHAQ